MRTLKNLLPLLLISLIATPLSAADSTGFKITPTARALFDAAAYLPQEDGFTPGVTCPDVRLGAKAVFGDFEARADVSYRFGKLYPADIYLKWTINPNSFLKGGFFVHQFGLQSATGASDKISMEEPVAQSAFGENRLLGAMYVWHGKAVHFAGSLYAQSDAMTKYANELGRTGVGATARAAWHPVTGRGNIFQIGASGLIQTAAFSGDTQNPVSTFKAPFPTKVSNVSCLSAEVDHVRSIFKLTPEVLWSKGRVAAEGQFYYLNVARRDGLHSFSGLGCYAMARVLLNRGAAYSYSSQNGYLATPGPKSWELVAGYSYADLDDTAAAIFGGRANSASLTMNYYINRYITWRVNYSYTDRPRSTGLPSRHANIFQTRIQFIF